MGDYEYDPDALQKKDMNHDNVVDASDFLMLLSEKENAFDKYDRTYKEDLEKTYGYAKTDLYVSVGDDWDSSKLVNQIPLCWRRQIICRKKH